MYETEVLTTLVARDNVTFAVDLVVTQNGAPFDLTDLVIRMQWRRGTSLALDAGNDRPTTVHTGLATPLVLADPGIVVTTNVAAVTLPVVALAALDVGPYVFDVIATTLDGFAWQLAGGSVDLKAGVSHD